MPKARRPEPPVLVSKNFTPEEIDAGIKKLERRIREVQALDPTKVSYSDAEVQTVQANLQDTVRDVFGPNSPEYDRHKHHWIWHGGINMGDGPYERQRKFAEGIVQTAKMLQGLVDRLKEKQADVGGDPAARAQGALAAMDLHPRIASVSTDLFEDGHYAEAVFSASKALVNFVKEKSGRHDLDGAKLMTTVFSANAPILAVNDLRDQTEIDEQQGTMHLFTGAVLAIRNPGGHGDPTYPPERALEYLGLLSLLAKRVEEAKRRKP